YSEKCYSLLNQSCTYKTITEEQVKKIFKAVQDGIKSQKRYIDLEILKYLLIDDPKPGRFYGLPKIHKPGVPVRPIVSNNQTVTENLSQIADFAIKEIPPSLPSYVKYTNHFLRILHSITDLPKDAILCTLDVSSLYTNIPTDEGIEATLEAYARLHDSAKPLDSHFLRKA